VSLWVEQTVAETSLDRDYVRSQLSLASRLDKVIERISRPAEKTLNWGEYRKIFIQPRRIESGRAFLAEHKALLQQAEEKYGVPAEIITAIIGVETFYGQHKGKDEALSSLATLAFDYPPRAKFFKRELQEFLLLAREEGFEPASIRGSYAAAMGMPQFISSSYRHYAVDFDGDGQRDLWNSVADVIGSVANYLNVHGWVTGGSVAERVEPSGDGYRNLLSKKLKPALRRKQLRQAGIITSVRSENEKTLMELQKGDNREVWVGFQNFFVITRYNQALRARPRYCYLPWRWPLAARIYLRHPMTPKIIARRALMVRVC